MSDHKLAAEVEKFNLALQEFDLASSNLDKLVETRMTGLKTPQDCIELIDSLPRRYRNIRRIYETMEQMSDVKTDYPKS